MSSVAKKTAGYLWAYSGLSGDKEDGELNASGDSSSLCLGCVLIFSLPVLCLYFSLGHNLQVSQLVISLSPSSLFSHHEIHIIRNILDIQNR